MENKLNFDFMLSLKEIAMRRVAINLWNSSDILVSIEKFSKNSHACCRYSEKWRESVENKVFGKLSKLEIPASLSKQLLLIITPIGLQIPKWKVFHEDYLEITGSEKASSTFLGSKYLEDKMPSSARLGAQVFKKLRWTSAGIIDYRQTAKELIQCEMIDIERRYLLSCLYCLEDCISCLWKELPAGVKRKYYNGENLSRSRISNLPYCWPYILREEQYTLDSYIQRTRDEISFNKFAVGDSTRYGNKVATEFFFQRLSNAERDVSFLKGEALTLLSHRSLVWNYLPEGFPPENSADVLCFLLSSMDYEQQMEIIQSDPIAVLNCFLHWPWQDYFMKIADLVWGLLSAERLYDMLISINRLFRHSKYCFPKFFQECFIRTPIKLRKIFVEYECHSGKLFPRFFYMQDAETIQVVFRNTEALDKIKLLFSEPIFQLIYDSILKESCHMVEVCFQEARLCKESREVVRKGFMKFLTRTVSGQIEMSNPVWMRFCQILDNAGDISQSKRSSEDENNTEAKKLHSDE